MFVGNFVPAKRFTDFRSALSGASFIRDCASAHDLIRIFQLVQV